MKKQFLILALAVPASVFADSVVTTPALSLLQNQMTQLQQQVDGAKQTIQSANQNLDGVTAQLKTLQVQIEQYGNPDLSQFKWVDVSDNALPANTFVAASNKGSPVQICQASYSNGSGYYGGNGNSVIDPGIVTTKGCVITFGGQAYLVPQYSVLTSNVAGYWISGEYIKSNRAEPVYALNTLSVATPKAEFGAESSAPAAPSNAPTPLYNALAIIGGQENGSNVYICRVQINAQYFVGKVFNNTCYIAAGKYEASWPVYEVLLTRKP